MSKKKFQILSASHSFQLEIELINDNIWFHKDDMREKFGWILKPEGLCKEEVCIPLKEPLLLLNNDHVNINQFAKELNRPIASEVSKGVIVLGESASDRANWLYAEQAPDFELPDLNGNMHRLSEHFGKKLCLVVHASW
ncbi:MAG: hypothetical protein DK305_000182 [Chloroflexi bacterium]|nr:MAG: hypothetical protein DK305_000182 [Chloroflexota bacterium]